MGLVLLAPVVYWLAPKLNRFIPLALMPIVLITALLITVIGPPHQGDTLEGRVGLTIANLGALDLRSLLGMEALDSARFADSGYVYVIKASSILGLLALWLLAGLIAAGQSPGSKRFSVLLNLYLFSNLMVSGTSVFSIKTAALLWFLAGFMRAQEFRSGGAAELPKPEPNSARSPAMLAGRLRSV